MKIKTRDVTITTGESYCSYCKEPVERDQLITLQDKEGDYRACPHCHEVFEGWSTNDK